MKTAVTLSVPLYFTLLDKVEAMMLLRLGFPLRLGGGGAPQRGPLYLIIKALFTMVIRSACTLIICFVSTVPRAREKACS